MLSIIQIGYIWFNKLDIVASAEYIFILTLEETEFWS